MVRITSLATLLYACPRGGALFPSGSGKVGDGEYGVEDNATAIHPKIATQSLFNSISAIYWRRLGPGFFGGRINIRGTGKKNVFTPVHFRLILIKCVDFE